MYNEYIYTYIQYTYTYSENFVYKITERLTRYYYVGCRKVLGGKLQCLYETRAREIFLFSHTQSKD